MRSTRWLPALMLALGVACAPAAALAAPTSLPGATGGCTTSGPQGTCGPYAYRLITNSNGFNTYVANNKWGCGNPDQCGRQTVQATSPGHWQVTSNQAAGNTAVLTYPEVQQVFTRTSNTNPPVAGFHVIYSHFAEAMHATAGTDAEAAYDIWLSSTQAHEVMIWVDNRARGTGGAKVIGHATIGGQAFTVLQYGGMNGELIFSLNRNETSGTIHILATLRWLVNHGLEPAGIRLGQVDFGWEICSTGGRPETFTVSAYSLQSECKTHGCM